MPAHAAATKELAIIAQDSTVKKALSQLKKAKTDFGAVINEDQKLIGLFSLQSLLKNILPVQVDVAGGQSISIDAAPGAAKRLNKSLELPVVQFMKQKINVITPDAPLWDALKQLNDTENPLIMVEPQSNKPIGYIDCNTAIAELQRMQK